MWGWYRGAGLSGQLVVDGGILSNFPLYLIASNLPKVKEVTGEDADQTKVHHPGPLIDEKLAVPGAGAAPRRQHRLRTANRVTRLIDCMSSARDNEMMRAHPEWVCRLPAMGYGTTELDMSGERLKLLVEAGAAALRSYLADPPKPLASRTATP